MFIYCELRRHIGSLHRWWYIQKQPPEVFYKKDALNNFAKLTGKQIKFKARGLELYWKRLRHRCFPANFEKIYGTPILRHISGWLLLYITISECFMKASSSRPYHFNVFTGSLPSSTNFTWFILEYFVPNSFLEPGDKLVDKNPTSEIFECSDWPLECLIAHLVKCFVRTVVIYRCVLN